MGAESGSPGRSWTSKVVVRSLRRNTYLNATVPGHGRHLQINVSCQSESSASLVRRPGEVDDPLSGFHCNPRGVLAGNCQGVSDFGYEVFRSSTSLGGIRDRVKAIWTRPDIHHAILCAVEVLGNGSRSASARSSRDFADLLVHRCGSWEAQDDGRRRERGCNPHRCDPNDKGSTNGYWEVVPEYGCDSSHNG